MLSYLRTTQRVLTPESLMSAVSTRASSPEQLSYPPLDCHESSDSLLLEPLTISGPRPLRALPVSVTDSLSSTLFSDNGLYESPFTDSPHPSIASTPPSPQHSRCTIPLPDTTEKKLYALNATEAAMTGNECQSNGTKVRDAVNKVIDFTLNFISRWFLQQEDADDDIREYLRSYKKKRHTPSGLPETPTDDSKYNLIDDQSTRSLMPHMSIDMSTDSDLPSYRTRRASDPDHPGDGWERYSWPEMVNIDMQIPDGLGNITLPKYVKYNLTPSYPTISGTLGANHPVHTRLLCPKRCVPLAKVKDLTPTQLRLFNQTEPCLNWVEEALDSEADRGLTAGIYQYRYYLREIAQVEARMERKAKTLQLLVTHKMEALADLLAADAYDHILNGIAWSSHFNLSTTDEEAYKAYREVTRIPPAEPKVRYTLRHTSLPHANACNLRAYRVQQERDHRFRATKKRCHRCRKFGHIRAHCPTKYNRF